MEVAEYSDEEKKMSKADIWFEEIRKQLDALDMAEVDAFFAGYDDVAAGDGVVGSLPEDLRRQWYFLYRFEKKMQEDMSRRAESLGVTISTVAATPSMRKGFAAEFAVRNAELYALNMWMAFAVRREFGIEGAEKVAIRRGGKVVICKGQPMEFLSTALASAARMSPAEA